MSVTAARGTRVFMPVFVEAKGVLGEKFTIRSLTGDDDLCKKVVDFLKSNKFEFYRNGEAYTHDDAVKTVNLLRDRFENGNPFSGFAVMEGKKMVGWIRIGFDRNPRKLQIAGMCLPEYQRQGYAQQALHWVLEDYLPTLHKQGFRFPVYGWDGKTVQEWVDLDKTSVVATVHPDFDRGNRLLTKAGFKLGEQIKIDGFSGVHDSRRNVYEIALKRFIHC